MSYPITYRYRCTTLRPAQEVLGDMERDLNRRNARVTNDGRKLEFRGGPFRTAFGREFLSYTAVGYVWLEDEVLHCKVHIGWTYWPTMLMWVLFVCAVASSSHAPSPWFHVFSACLLIGGIYPIVALKTAKWCRNFAGSGSRE